MLGRRLSGVQTFRTPVATPTGTTPRTNLTEPY
jgi:hypothetical protein